MRVTQVQKYSILFALLCLFVQRPICADERSAAPDPMIVLLGKMQFCIFNKDGGKASVETVHDCAATFPDIFSHCITTLIGAGDSVPEEHCGTLNTFIASLHPGFENCLRVNKSVALQIGVEADSVMNLTAGVCSTVPVIDASKDPAAYESCVKDMVTVHQEDDPRVLPFTRCSKPELLEASKKEGFRKFLALSQKLAMEMHTNVSELAEAYRFSFVARASQSPGFADCLENIIYALGTMDEDNKAEPFNQCSRSDIDILGPSKNPIFKECLKLHMEAYQEIPERTDGEHIKLSVGKCAEPGALHDGPELTPTPQSVPGVQ